MVLIRTGATARWPIRGDIVDQDRDGHPCASSIRYKDAILWLVIPGLILWIIPIGSVSGDGIAQSAAFLRGSWSYNPNHLLMEPVGSWWQAWLGSLGSNRPGPDVLKLLSILSGAASLGIFRAGIAGALAPDRVTANFATAWVALSSAFSRLWISDEIHMLQMPALMLCSAFLVATEARRSLPAAFLAGVFGGFAAMVYISNILVPVTAAVVFGLWYASASQRSTGIRTALAVGGGAVVTAGLGLLTAWKMVAPAGADFLEWVTRYGGGTSATRLSESYGLVFSARGVAVSAARAVYGAISSIVDAAPLVEWIRDGRGVAPAIAGSFIALVAGCIFLLAILHRTVRTTERPTASTTGLLLAVSVTAAVGAFAIYWNNSDDQFYFQLSIATGALIATVRWRTLGMFAGLAAIALGWNAWEMVTTRIMYPRAERVAELRKAVDDAGLVVYPGYDEVDQLLFFIPELGSTRKVSITSLAAEYPPEEGLSALQRRIRDVLATGKRVEVIAVFDVPVQQNPWKHLASVGYDHHAVVAALGELPIDASSRAVGPFPIRSVMPFSGVGQETFSGELPR